MDRTMGIKIIYIIQEVELPINVDIVAYYCCIQDINKEIVVAFIMVGIITLNLLVVIIINVKYCPKLA